jgi:hypothetical protein
MVEMTEMLLTQMETKCCKAQWSLVAFLGYSLHNYSELDSLYNEGRSRALVMCNFPVHVNQGKLTLILALLRT